MEQDCSGYARSDNSMISRRRLLQFLAGLIPVAYLPGYFLRALGAPTTREVARGPFEPTWDSLKQYRAPDWFRDAKFGIWAHWTAQCVPEQGDWYARNMYLQGTPQNKFHVEKYGHPSKFGFMEIDNLWKAEKWDPAALMAQYVKAGAKYFVALANHHDNFDNYDSKYHAWNSMRVGPKKDIVGTWAKLTRDAGLRFGVTNHSAHAWHWFQPAYGYDPEGDMAGVRYDAYTLTKEDGKGKWWEGLDIERGRADHILEQPWQTDTCIGDWHYRRSTFEQHKYKSAATVIRTLIDIVSKNGNLLLNIPLRGDGTIDADEQKVLADLAEWMPANGEAIYGTRPFSVFGEGAQDVKGSGNFNERQSRPYTAEDIRFTTKADTLYAFSLAWPENANKISIKTLAKGSEKYPKEIGKIELLGSDGALKFSREAQALVVTLPEQKPNSIGATLRITPTM